MNQPSSSPSSKLVDISSQIPSTFLSKPPLLLLSEAQSLSLSNMLSMIISTALSMPAQEDEHVDKHYSNDNLTIMESDAQASNCDWMLSAVANDAADRSEATCEVVNQQVADKLSKQIKFFQILTKTKMLVIIFSIKVVADILKY